MVEEDDLTPDAILTRPFDIDHLYTVVDALTRGVGVGHVVTQT